MSSRRTFEHAVDADFDVLMTWFPGAEDVGRWGGPEFEHPFTAASFRRDCRWPGIPSYSLRDDDGTLLAFGQFYDRNGYINLARIGVRPGSRGQGIGRELMSRLMTVGRARLQLPSWSLFVYRDNEAALRCYRALGFEIRPYPPGEKLAGECFFMTRRVDDGAGDRSRGEKNEQ